MCRAVVIVHVTKVARGAGAARRRRPHGQGITTGASQSAVPHAHSAKVSEAQLADSESPLRQFENVSHKADHRPIHGFIPGGQSLR
jgi:hypothetical protein